MYEAGTGVAQDDVRAATLYEQACNSGAPRGCFSLAQMMDVGRGVRQDPPRATELRRRACTEGYTRACQ
jgi:hypothetical protein